MSERFFALERDDRWFALLLPFGVSRRDGVTVDGDTVRASFGFWSLETARSNVVAAARTESATWWKAVGLRLSLADDGLTFGSSPRNGVCVEFADRVGPVVGFRRHSSLWISVADPDGVVAALQT